jgi:cyclopropane fatty-acyl-phospholipid synthase-like methyltransferase
VKKGYRQSQAFFDSRYQEDTDPWQFASSAYELNRYHATLAALSRARYRRAYEPGCSVGVLTSALARRCEQVIACDISPTAVRQAQERCAAEPNVSIQVWDVGETLPSGRFDLIVFSELGYYFPVNKLRTLARNLDARLEKDGELIAVHWLGLSGDHVLHGDSVHDVLSASLSLEPLSHSRHSGFRIDSWRCP